MSRLAFTMKLRPGYANEYQKRHDQIWPELISLLKDSGISQYSIFLDEKTNVLFGALTVAKQENMDKLPDFPVMQRWWKYMSDIMESNPDRSPVSIHLKEVFYLP